MVCDEVVVPLYVAPSIVPAKSELNTNVSAIAPAATVPFELTEVIVAVASAKEAGVGAALPTRRTLAATSPSPVTPSGRKSNESPA